VLARFRVLNAVGGGSPNGAAFAQLDWPAIAALMRRAGLAGFDARAITDARAARSLWAPGLEVGEGD